MLRDSEANCSVNVSLRAVTADDRHFLASLFHEVRRAEFAPLGLAEPMLMQLLEMQHRGQIAGYAGQFPEASDRIVWQGEERAGRLLVARDKNEIHLVDIAVMASHRGHGIGSLLIRQLCEEAREKHLPLRLSVRAGNPAERLYSRLGFRPCDGDGQNVLMQWSGDEEAL